MVETPETTNSTVNTSSANKPAAGTIKGAAEHVTAGFEEAATIIGQEAGSAAVAASSNFDKAIEDAKSSAGALKDEAIARASAMRDKVTGATSEWSDQAAQAAAQAKDKGIELAKQGKSKATDALSAVGTTIADSASLIDEKLGVQYGDYARGTARSIQETAAKLEAKDFNEIGDDVAGFVRKSPATALSIAAISGFLIAKLFRRSGSSDS